MVGVQENLLHVSIVNGGQRGHVFQTPIFPTSIPIVALAIAVHLELHPGTGEQGQWLLSLLVVVVLLVVVGPWWLVLYQWRRHGLEALVVEGEEKTLEAVMAAPAPRLIFFNSVANSLG